MIDTAPAKRFENFSDALTQIETEIQDLLPEGVSLQRFITTAKIAVKRDPDLLAATPKSLFEALRKAAADGLYPDGTEGVIQVHSTKVKYNDNGVWRERWERQATWMPMVRGLYKRFAQFGIKIDAAVVHQNDVWRRAMGDDPAIVHEEPADKGPRGPMWKVYAIFRELETGKVLHREVLEPDQIEAIRAKSKSPNGMLWKDFADQAWIKSAVHRGSKYIALVPELADLLSRDHDHFSFGDRQPVERLESGSPRIAASLGGLIDIPEGVGTDEAEAGDEVPPKHLDAPGPSQSATEAAPESTGATDDVFPGDIPEAASDQDRERAFLARLREKVSAAETAEALVEIQERNAKTIKGLSPAGRKAAAQIYLEAGRKAAA